MDVMTKCTNIETKYTSRAVVLLIKPIDFDVVVACRRRRAWLRFQS